MWENILNLCWMLICIVVVLFLAYLFTKYVGKRGGLGSYTGGRRGDIKVISQLTLGKDRQLLLIQMGERYFLLGSTASGITNLAEFTPEEAEKWQKDAEQQEVQQPPSFSEALRTVLKQKGKR